MGLAYFVITWLMFCACSVLSTSQKKLCDTRVWYINIITDAVFDIELNKEQLELKNSIETLVLNSADSPDSRWTDCKILYMYNDMLKETFKYTSSNLRMPSKEVTVEDDGPNDNVIESKPNTDSTVVEDADEVNTEKESGDNKENLPDTHDGVKSDIISNMKSDIDNDKINKESPEETEDKLIGSKQDKSETVEDFVKGENSNSNSRAESNITDTDKESDKPKENTDLKFASDTEKTLVENDSELEKENTDIDTVDDVKPDNKAIAEEDNLSKVDVNTTTNHNTVDADNTDSSEIEADGEKDNIEETKLKSGESKEDLPEIVNDNVEKLDGDGEKKDDVQNIETDEIEENPVDETVTDVIGESEIDETDIIEESEEDETTEEPAEGDVDDTEESDDNKDDTNNDGVVGDSDETVFVTRSIPIGVCWSFGCLTSDLTFDDGLELADKAIDTKDLPGSNSDVSDDKDIQSNPGDIKSDNINNKPHDANICKPGKLCTNKCYLMLSFSFCMPGYSNDSEWPTDNTNDKLVITSNEESIAITNKNDKETDILVSNNDDNKELKSNHQIARDDDNFREDKANLESNNIDLEIITIKPSSKEEVAPDDNNGAKDTIRTNKKNADPSSLAEFEQLIHQKTREYAPKIHSLELMIMKLENQLLVEKLNKHNHSSTITRLENLILKLENDLLKMSKNYQNLREEAESINKKQNKYLEIANKQQEQITKRPELPDHSAKNFELITQHQNKINELTDVLKNQSSVINELKHRQDYLEDQNRMLHQMIMNQTIFMTTIIQTVQDLSQQNSKNKQEIGDLKKNLQTAVEANKQTMLEKKLRMSINDKNVIDKLDSLMFDNQEFEDNNDEKENDDDGADEEEDDAEAHLKFYLAEKTTEQSVIRWCPKDNYTCPICYYNSVVTSQCVPFKRLFWSPCQGKCKYRHKGLKTNKHEELPNVPKIQDNAATHTNVQGNELRDGNKEVSKENNQANTGNYRKDLTKIKKDDNVIKTQIDNTKSEETPTADKGIIPVEKVEKEAVKIKSDGGKININTQDDTISKTNSVAENIQTNVKESKKDVDKVDKIEKEKHTKDIPKDTADPIKEKTQDVLETNVKSEKREESDKKAETNKLSDKKNENTSKTEKPKPDTSNNAKNKKVKEELESSSNKVKTKSAPIETKENVKQDTSNDAKKEKGKEELESGANKAKTKTKEKIKTEEKKEKKHPINLVTEKQREPKDCYDYYSRGNKKDGLYKVKAVGSGKMIEVFCDMRKGGWTVIQRRQDGTTNFFQEWNDYKKGFGGLYGEHWLGNDNIHFLTNQDYYKLRVDLMDWNKDKKFALFDNFLVESETEGYRIHIDGYSGDAGDGLTKHDGHKFSTKDVDNDKVVKEFGGSCAKRFHGAGWYYKCYASNLNGKFYKGGKIPEKQFDGVTWKPWTGPNYSLKKVEMKIRPASVVKN